MEPVLQIRDLQKSFRENEVLRGVSFEIFPGQIVGLLGPNGSGKTTLIKIINTLITDFRGEVLVNRSPLGIASKQAISYLPDSGFVRTELRVAAALKFYAGFFGDFDLEKAREMLRWMNLDETAYVKNLSKGMQEKLQLVMTLARRAKLYIFDEPIAGVDPAAREFILKTIIRNYNEEAAILMSTHLISDAEPILGRVLFLKNGRIDIDEDAEALREARKQSIDAVFREEYKC